MGNDSSKHVTSRGEPLMTHNEVTKLLRQQKLIYEKQLEELNKESRGMSPEQVKELLEEQKKSYESKFREYQNQTKINGANMGMSEADIKALLEAQKQEYEARYNQISQQMRPTPSAPPASTAGAASTERRSSPYNFNRETLQHVQQSSSNTLYPNLPSTSYQQETSFAGPSTSSTNIQSQGPLIEKSNGNSGLNKHNKGKPSMWYNQRSKAQRHSTNRNTADDQNVNCPTCGNRFGLHIFQCSSGHSSCEDCKFVGRPCGTCRGTITAMRNIALEDCIGQLKVPCKNQSEGCNLYLKMFDMDIHEKECPYKELACPLAFRFGNCYWTGKGSNIRAHFDERHPDCKAEVDKEMSILNLRNHSINLYLVVLGGLNFLLHIAQDGQSIKVAVQLIGTRMSATKWRYEFHMYNKAEPRRKYQHTDICTSNSDQLNEIFHESRCLNIPLTYAETFENHGQLNFKFFIKRDADDSEQKNDRNRRYGRFKGQMDKNQN